MMNFDELAKYHSLSLMRWDEDFYASENTQLAKAFYEAGKQSKQAEIDELRKNFNNALKTIEIQQRFLDDADGANKILTSQASDLQKRIDDALEKCKTGIRKQGGDYYLELIEGILKGDTK